MIVEETLRKAVRTTENLLYKESRGVYELEFDRYQKLIKYTVIALLMKRCSKYILKN